MAATMANPMSRDEVVEFTATLIRRAEDHLAGLRAEIEDLRPGGRIGEEIELRVELHGYEKQREALVYLWEMATDENWPLEN